MIILCSDILLVGDSLIRHISSAMNILIRKDLRFGALSLGDINPTEALDYGCDGQFAEHGIFLYFVRMRYDMHIPYIVLYI